jgi:hypothetical protein
VAFEIPEERGVDVKQFHFSTAECFDNCPRRFELTYLQELQTLPTDDPQNPLILGTAIHRGMETDLETAVSEYVRSYPVIDDRHVTEIIKFEHWIPRLKELLPEGLHEVPFENEYYKGTADLLVPVDDQTYDLYDFKYSNNISHYVESRQLHVYKHYLEEIKKVSVRHMYFVFIPKVMIRQKQTETVYQFRQRLQEELDKVDIQIREVKFDQSKVDDFHHTCMKIGVSEQFEPNYTYLCDWCEFKDYCQKGRDYMILPSATRRNINTVTRRKLMIYGRPTSGKTVFLDKAPDPLNLNTDGNIQFVTMQYIPIKDTYEGRQKILAWDVFKKVMDELERTAGQNGFKTLIIDLTEDLYESCRIYMYNKLGITHESDDSFRAWDKVRTEFLSNIRKFMNLDYENIVLVCQEDATKDITKKSGDKITAIKPNIPDKIATKLAGMVDIVARVVAEEDGSRTLTFRSDEVVFGGGRLRNISKTTIPLDWNELMKVYDEANRPAQDDTEDIQKKVQEAGEEEPAEEEKVPEKGTQEATDTNEYWMLTDGSVKMVKADEPAPEGADHRISHEEFDQELLKGNGQVATRQRRKKEEKEAEDPAPRRRRRRSDPEPETPPAEPAEAPAEEAPRRRTRRTRKEG